MRRTFLAALFLIGALLPVGARAQRVPCGATGDPIVSTICASTPRLEREIGLAQNFAAAVLLTDEPSRKAMRTQQSDWENRRRKACQDPASGGIAACVDAMTDARAQQVAGLLPQVLDGKGGHLNILDKRLDVWLVDHPWPRQGTWVQLRHDTRVIVEGRQGFQVLARSGDGTTEEAVVIRAPAHSDFSGHQLFAVVVTRNAGIEVWPLMGHARGDSLGIRVGAAGFTVTGNRYRDDRQSEVRWTPRNGWRMSEPEIAGEKPEAPIEVTEVHAPEPPIRTYCDEPRTPVLSAACSRPEFEQAEAALGKAVRDCLATLGPDERALLIERHNERVDWMRRIFSRNPPPVSDDGYQAESYRDCANGDVVTSSYSKIKREPQTIVIGSKKLVETWLPYEHSVPFMLVLRMGTSVAIEAAAGHVEVVEEAKFGDTSVAILDTPLDGGTEGCHARYLAAATPGRPLRLWHIPDANGCLTAGAGREFKIEQTVGGYRFEMSPSLLADGAVYRWTPDSGMTFEKALAFQPQPGSRAVEYRDAIRRAEGPSVGLLADYLYLARVIPTPGSDYTVLGDCDQLFRACAYRGTSPLRALFQDGGNALYVAVYDRHSQGAACGADFPFRPRPGIPSERALLDIPIEYHLARERWPSSALEVLRTTFCPPS